MRAITIGLVLLIALHNSNVYGKQSFQAKIPNGGRVPGHPALGHKSATSGNSLNNFGRDYERYDGRWTTAFCNADSDGDGQSNGLELGDPNCVWTRGATPQRLTLISDPSDSSSRTTASPTYTDPLATPSPPITSVPPLGPSQTQSVLGQSAGLITVLANRFSIGWNVLSSAAGHGFEQQQSSTGTAILETTLVMRGDYYGGYGVAASKMTGPFVACYVTGTGSASCKDMLCDSGFTVTERSPQVSTVVSATKNSTHSVVVVRTPASALTVVNGATQRVIFAVGPWDKASNTPLQHASSRDYTTARINFYSGSGTAPPVPTTPSPPTTPATPSPPLTPAQSLPAVSQSSGLISVLPNRFSIGWTVLSSAASHGFDQQQSSIGTAILETTLVMRGDYYGGYGVAASKMTGPFVACYVTGTGSASCKDMLCDSGYTVTERSPQVSTVVSATKNSTHAVVVVRTPTSALTVVNGAAQRVIFAVGSWDAGANVPLEHDSSSDYTTGQINFYSGSATVQAKKSRLDWLALGLGALGAFLLTLLAAIVNALGFVPTRRQRTVIWSLTAFSIAALIVMVWGISFAGYQRDGASSPVGRAFGNCVTYIFFLLMWPTTKHVGPVHVLGLAYEKVLIVHICLGVVVLVFMTVHFGVIWDSYARDGGQAAARDQILKWEWSRDEPRSNLAGVLSWLFLVLMVLPALLIRRKAYSVFRVTHLLFVLVLVFGALHHAPMAILLSPPLLVYIIDMLVRFATQYLTRPQIHSAVVHCEYSSIGCPTFTSPLVRPVVSPKHLNTSASGSAGEPVYPLGARGNLPPISPCAPSPRVTVVSSTAGEPLLIELDIRVSSFTLRPGQYAFLGFQGVLAPNLHPFSIARFIPNAGSASPVITRRGSAATKDNATALSGPGIIKFFIQPTSPLGWTTRLAKLIQSGETLGNVTFMGPYGRLQVPLEGNRRIFLVAGGVGITPMMSTLQYCVSRIVSGDASLSELESITLIWVVRHHQVLHTIRPHLEEMVEPLLGCAWRGKVQILVHQTGRDPRDRTTNPVRNGIEGTTEMRKVMSGPLGVPSPAADRGSNVWLVEGRPNFEQYFADHHTDLAKSNPSRSTVYACGSESLIDGVEAGLKPYPEIFLHTESFDF
jgi:predicted ferric reductase